MDRWSARRLSAHAGFGFHGRLPTTKPLASFRRTDVVSDRVFKNPAAVQPRFFAAGRFLRGERSRFDFSPVRIHPRRAWRAQILMRFQICRSSSASAEKRPPKRRAVPIAETRRAATVRFFAVGTALDDKGTISP